MSKISVKNQEMIDTIKYIVDTSVSVIGSTSIINDHMHDHKQKSLMIDTFIENELPFFAYLSINKDVNNIFYVYFDENEMYIIIRDRFENEYYQQMISNLDNSEYSQRKIKEYMLMEKI